MVSVALLALGMTVLSRGIALRRGIALLTLPALPTTVTAPAPVIAIAAVARAASALALPAASALALPVASALALPVALPAATPLTGLTAWGLLPAAGGLRSAAGSRGRRAWPMRRRSRLRCVVDVCAYPTVAMRHGARGLARRAGHDVPHQRRGDQTCADRRPSNGVVLGLFVRDPSPGVVRRGARSSRAIRVHRCGRDRATDRRQAGRRQAAGSV